MGSRPAAELAERIAGLGVAIGESALGERAPIRHPPTEGCISCRLESLPRYVTSSAPTSPCCSGSPRRLTCSATCSRPGVPRPERPSPKRVLPGALPAHGRNDRRPLEPRCSCPAPDCFSRAHLRHLHLTQQLPAHRLLGVHNLHHPEVFWGGPWWVGSAGRERRRWICRHASARASPAVWLRRHSCDAPG